MNSNRLFLRATFAGFAFVIASVHVVGSPTKDELHDDDSLSSFFGFENMNGCEYSALSSVPLQREISFFYYTKENPEGKLFDFAFQPVPDIFFTTKTKVLTHGFRDSIDSPEFGAIITAYLNSSEYLNLLAFNWTSYSSEKYQEAAKFAILIGKIISPLFCILYKYYDIYAHQIHFIGYGLGAQLLAATARESRTRIGRITGLDPARLCFEVECENSLYPSLSGNDAEFVDILHTDANKHGIFYPQGTVDFYANEGKNQPLCHAPNATIPIPEDCDAKSSYLYFADSIVIPGEFYGGRCEIINSTLNCRQSPGMYWGEYMDTVGFGLYNFNTQAESSYEEEINDFSDDFNF